MWPNTDFVTLRDESAVPRKKETNHDIALKCEDGLYLYGNFFMLFEFQTVFFVLFFLFKGGFKI